MAHASTTSSGADSDHGHRQGKLVALAVGAIGVVCGDIGTSPLYAFREAVNHAARHGLAGHEAVLGVLSLIIWALFLIVTLKYVIVLLRADNNGEGGTFALMVLGQSVAQRSSKVLFTLGVIGASFFYGDAVLTPAISVLSAVEGLKLVTSALEPAVLPVTIVIIIGLFAMQARGTDRVAAYFGPVTLIWFLLLALGGLLHILDDQSVLLAFNPYYGLNLLFQNGLLGFAILGLVFLAVTGAEALYADLGHFGRAPIQLAWGSVVLPCLLLNYLGQGALVLADPKAMANPFFNLYPGWALIPMVVMASISSLVCIVPS